MKTEEVMKRIEESNRMAQISNEPLTPNEQQDAIKAYTQYLEDEVERYKGYWQECSLRSEQLTAENAQLTEIIRIAYDKLGGVKFSADRLLALVGLQITIERRRSERNEQLTAALKALVYAHGQDVEPMTTEESCYYCGVQMQDDGDALDYNHAPDCAWARAKGMVDG